MSNLRSPKSVSSIKILPSEHGRHITWWERYTRGSIYAKTFLFISTIHAISLMVVGSISIGWIDVPPIYGSLSIYIAICFLWFMLQGVLKENTIQLTCSIVSAMLITIYLIWFWLIDTSHNIVKLLAFGSTCFCILYLIIAPCVIKKFGWYRYNKSQTTNKHTMKIYYVYQKFQSMLLMDAEICIMLGLLVVFELHHDNDVAYIGNICCCVFEIFWVALGIKAVRTEHKLVTQTFMACTIFLVAYVLSICYWIVTDKQYSEETSALQFFVLGALIFVVRGISMYWTVRVILNFNKGLREYFDQGIHYIDFWGQSNKKLLANNDGSIRNVCTNSAAIAASENTNSTNGMSSRSRINSDDFD